MSKSGIETRSGIEEALEQQAEPQGIDVGDGQRIGDQRACARTAARPDRISWFLAHLMKSATIRK
jgi:hypothetical protein